MLSVGIQDKVVSPIIDDIERYLSEVKREPKICDRIDENASNEDQGKATLDQNALAEQIKDNQNLKTALEQFRGKVCKYCVRFLKLTYKNPRCSYKGERAGRTERASGRSEAIWVTNT